MASQAPLDGPRGFSLALMITASGGRSPKKLWRAAALASVASVMIGTAVTSAADHKNERRPIRAMRSSVSDIEASLPAAAAGASPTAHRKAAPDFYRASWVN